MKQRSETKFTFRASKQLFELEVMCHQGRVQVGLLRVYAKMEQAYISIARSEQILAQGMIEQLNGSDARSELVKYFERRGYEVKVDW